MIYIYIYIYIYGVILRKQANKKIRGKAIFYDLTLNNKNENNNNINSNMKENSKNNSDVT